MAYRRAGSVRMDIKRKKRKEFRLSYVVTVACMCASLIIALLIGIFALQMFERRTDSQMMEEVEADSYRFNTGISSWLRSIMQLSDAVYYDVIMNVDYQVHDMTKAFELLYDSSKSAVENITLFDADGEVVFTVPAAVKKKEADVTSKEWFQDAMQRSENIAFYAPHVQNLFESGTENYKWTLAMCRPVLLTKGSSQEKGVLLVSLKYSGLEQVMEDTASGESVYLTDRDGNIVYHPQKWLLTEEEKAACSRRALSGNGRRKEDGTYFSVQNIGYTGWMLVTEKESSAWKQTGGRAISFYLLMAMSFVTILILLNMLVSYFVTSPFRSLQKAVQQIQSNNMDISVEKSGIYEINRLGEALMQMTARIRELIRNINEEHEQKRKLEMDTLQSQINPHFLYNTLDVIVWMIENQKPKEAARAVVMLAKFFRISLSKGKNVITVKEEFEHVKSYLYIQNLKYKNQFTYPIEMEEGTETLTTLKLVLQPLVENSIAHGIIHMEDEGEIWITSHLEGEDLLMCVRDNGWGMTEDKVQSLLAGEAKAEGGHSGIGVKNVNQRIRLYYGENYGLFIESEPDEGTSVTVRIPVVR